MFLCIDVGNSRIKLAAFRDGCAADTLPESAVAATGDAKTWPPVDQWLSTTWTQTPPRCWIASVSRSVSKELSEHLARRHSIDHVHSVAWHEFPLQIAPVPPESVGVDRLAAAFAAHQLTESKRAAIVVDLGSAITVDRVSAEGCFEGGAILPGVELAAESLHRRTDALPHVELSREHAPALPGKSTEEAIQAGLYWGAVGSVRELVSRLAAGMEPAPTVFVTGGGAAAFAPALGDQARHEPDLVLRGVAQVATRLEA